MVKAKLRARAGRFSAVTLWTQRQKFWLVQVSFHVTGGIPILQRHEKGRHLNGNGWNVLKMAHDHRATTFGRFSAQTGGLDEKLHAAFHISEGDIDMSFRGVRGHATYRRKNKVVAVSGAMKNGRGARVWRHENLDNCFGALEGGRRSTQTLPRVGVSRHGVH